MDKINIAEKTVRDVIVTGKAVLTASLMGFINAGAWKQEAELDVPKNILNLGRR